MLGTGLSVPSPGGAHHPCLWVCFGRFSASSERDPREVMYLPGIPRHPAPRGAASCPPRHAASVTKATSRDQVPGKRVPRGDEQDHLHVTISVGPEQTAGWPVFIFLRNNNPWKDINYTFFLFFAFVFFLVLRLFFALYNLHLQHFSSTRSIQIKTVQPPGITMSVEDSSPAPEPSALFARECARRGVSIATARGRPPPRFLIRGPLTK